MDYKKESGIRLRHARLEKNLTLNDVASKIEGMSASRISNYEQGIRSMGPADAASIGDVLDISAAYLLCLDDTVLSPTEQALIDNYRHSDERGRQMIRGIADAQSTYEIKDSSHG